MRSILTPLALALSFSACASSRLAAHYTVVAREADAHVEARIRVIDGSARLVVPGRLGESPVSWSVDTSASDHSMEVAAARRRGLLAGSGQPLGLALVTDGSMLFGPQTNPVSISLFGGPTAAPLPYVTFDRAAFDEAGIAGIVSPQRFAPAEGAIELDLRDGTIFRLGHDARIHARDALTRIGVQLEACDFGRGGVLPIADATVDGARVRMIVGTGSPLTILFADTAAGVDASMRASRHVLSREASNNTDLAIVPEMRIAVGGGTATVRALVMARSIATVPRMCGADGVIGLDVLRGCTVVLDAVGGALACETPVRGVDTAPILDSLHALPTPTPFPAHPDALTAGTAARLGCETVADSEVASWSRDRGLATPDANDRAIRARVIAHLAPGLHIDITPDDVDRVIETVRANNNLDAPGFEAELARQHTAMAIYRAQIADQLRESRVVGLLTPVAVPPTELDARAELTRRGAHEPFDAAALESASSMLLENAMRASADGLVARLRDRLARVAVSRASGSCRENWPAFYLSQIDFVGVSHSTERAIRMAVARMLEGRTLSLDAPGILPRSIVDAIALAVAVGAHEPRVTAREDGARLRVTVE